MVTPLGCGVETTWKSLTEGGCGIRAITPEDIKMNSFDRETQLHTFDQLTSKVAAIVPCGTNPGEFNQDLWLNSKVNFSSNILHWGSVLALPLSCFLVFCIIWFLSFIVGVVPRESICLVGIWILHCVIYEKVWFWWFEICVWYLDEKRNCGILVVLSSIFLLAKDFEGDNMSEYILSAAEVWITSGWIEDG